MRFAKMIFGSRVRRQISPGFLVFKGGIMRSVYRGLRNITKNGSQFHVSIEEREGESVASSKRFQTGVGSSCQVLPLR